MSFSPSSKARLTTRDLGRFPDDSLFHRIARAVCEAGCLPRKELYEAWEMARRVRRVFRGGRIVDFAAGHGLLAQVLLILDDTSPSALVVDERLPPSCAKLHQVLLRQWPRLAGRVIFVTSRIEDVEVRKTDLVVSCHACGALTDRVLEMAVCADARVAVLPCCHDGHQSRTGGLTGWMDEALAVDAVRALMLDSNGFAVRTQVIPAEITPKNRLLIADPDPPRRPSTRR